MQKLHIMNIIIIYKLLFLATIMYYIFDRFINILLFLRIGSLPNVCIILANINNDTNFTLLFFVYGLYQCVINCPSVGGKAREK